MKWLRTLLDRQARHFEPGGKLEKLYPLWEAQDTILFTPGNVTEGASHVRDGLDLKRMMMTVVLSLAGCIFMAAYNTGYQANLAIAQGAPALENWQSAIVAALGMGFSPDSFVACVLHGALYYLPVLLVTFAVGGAWEVLFAVVRRHEVNEGFLVTGMLFPLILSPTIPLWQVALGISFGTVIGKEVFGGTGMNVLNPALVGRAFLFFAYPANLSGDTVWLAAQTSVDGVSGATALARATLEGTAGVTAGLEWWDAFVGIVPGSMGETSALACLVGATLLIVTGVGSWRTMLGVTVGTFVMATVLNSIGSGHQSVLRYLTGVALRVGRVGLRHRLHGDRPGVGPVVAGWTACLRHAHRHPRGADPRRQPGVPRRDDAGDPLHEPVCPADRLRGGPG